MHAAIFSCPAATRLPQRAQMGGAEGRNLCGTKGPAGADFHFDRCVSHGPSICPVEPLNTTQLIGEAL